MTAKNPFTDQVSLLVSLLPFVAKQRCFALKGGTAINLFIRDLPRLSVDIDLAYLPVQARDTSLAAIDRALGDLSAEIEKHDARVVISASMLKDTAMRFKRVVSRENVSVKIEVSPVLRGSVYPSELHQISSRVASDFGFARNQLLSFEDLYAGKICAALDRQHPRDLYDLYLLLQNEGLTERLKNAFLVYLMSHNRPMAELLAPQQQNLSARYRLEFEGMTYTPVTVEQLDDTFKQLVLRVHGGMTDADRKFLLDLKRGNPRWDEFVLPEAKRLPAIQWKIANLAKMTPAKRKAAAEKLEKVLLG